VTKESLNLVHRCEIGRAAYAVKRIHTDDVPIRQAEGEAVGSAIAELFGANVSPAKARLVQGPDGLEAEVVSRWVDGVDLDELAPGQLLSLKRQYAESRIFSMILGDYDRKMANFKFDPKTGQLITLDCGMAHVTVEGRVVLLETRDHWFNRAKGAPDKLPKELLMEQSLTYQSMKPAIDRAKKVLAQSEGELRERIKKAMLEVHGDEAKAELRTGMAMEAIRYRIENLEDVLKDINKERNGFPMDLDLAEQTVWLLVFPSALRRAA
jgi:hypothetical protein